MRALFLAASLIAMTGAAMAEPTTSAAPVTTHPPAAAHPTPHAAAAPTQGGAQQITYIEPQNALEQTFVSAVDHPDMRVAFRQQFLQTRVALALSSRDPEAPPRQIDLPSGGKACLIFTSAARASAVMGDSAAVVMLTGREALTRVRGTNVVINIDLHPFLTLDAEGVDAFLAIPHPPEEAPPAAPPAQPSTGPSQ